MFNSNKGDKILRNKLHKDNKNSMKKTLKSLLKSMYHTCARTHTHTHALEQMGDLTVFGQGDNTIKMSVFTNYKFNMITTKNNPRDFLKVQVILNQERRAEKFWKKAEQGKRLSYEILNYIIITTQ